MSEDKQHDSHTAQETFQQKLVLTVVDKGMLALIVGVLILSGQYIINKTLQISSTEFAYKGALAEAKIEKYEQLWTSIHEYTYSMISAFQSNDSLTEKKTKMNQAIVNLNESFSKNGIYIGVDESNRIKDSVDFSKIAIANDTGNSDIIGKALNEFVENNIAELKKLQREINEVKLNQ